MVVVTREIAEKQFQEYLKRHPGMTFKATDGGGYDLTDADGHTIAIRPGYIFPEVL